MLYAGITAAVESVKKIIHPEKPDYSAVSLVIIAVAVVVKIVLGRYVKNKGEAVNSEALVASGTDALSDAVLSASVLASALVYLASGISLEAWVGAVFSAMIIRSGIEMISETLDKVLGTRADRETTSRIKQLLTEEPEVRGAYDLIINNYGPDKNYASVHLELPDTMTVAQLDDLTRRVETKVYRETGGQPVVALGGIQIGGHPLPGLQRDIGDKFLQRKVLLLLRASEHLFVVSIAWFGASFKTARSGVFADFPG